MNDAKSSPNHDEVATRARSLWEQAGQPAGRDEEFWYRAEQELREAGKSLRPPVTIAPPTQPPPIPASPLNEVPPSIRGAVKSPSRRPPRLGASKRPSSP